MQLRIGKQKKEEAKLKSQIASIFGTDDLANDRQQTMMTINKEVDALKKKYDAAKLEQLDIERFQQKVGQDGGETSVAINQASREIAIARKQFKDLSKQVKKNAEDRETYIKIVQENHRLKRKRNSSQIPQTLNGGNLYGAANISYGIQSARKSSQVKPSDRFNTYQVGNEYGTGAPEPRGRNAAKAALMSEGNAPPEGQPPIQGIKSVRNGAR